MSNLKQEERGINAESGMIEYSKDTTDVKVVSYPGRSLFLRIVQFISQNITEERRIIMIEVPQIVVELTSKFFPDLSFSVYNFKQEPYVSEDLKISMNELPDSFDKTFLVKLFRDFYDKEVKKGKSFMFFSNFFIDKTLPPYNKDKVDDTFTVASYNKHMYFINLVGQLGVKVSMRIRLPYTYNEANSKMKIFKGHFYWPAWNKSTGTTTYLEPILEVIEGKFRFKVEEIDNKEYDELCSYQNRVVRTKKYDNTLNNRSVRIIYVNNFDSSLEIQIIKQYLGDSHTNEVNIMKLYQEINKGLSRRKN